MKLIFFNKKYILNILFEGYNHIMVNILSVGQTQIFQLDLRPAINQSINHAINQSINFGHSDLDPFPPCPGSPADTDTNIFLSSK